MLTLTVKNQSLQKELNTLLNEHFGGDSEKMLQELVQLYATRLERLQFSGILDWETDGVAYQKELRREWE